MDITHKYGFVKMLGADLVRTLGGGEPPDAAESGFLFSLAGLMRGENGYGLWMEVDVVMDRDRHPLQTGLSSKGEVFFVFWQSVRSIVVYETKPENPPVGFRPS